MHRALSLAALLAATVALGACGAAASPTPSASAAATAASSPSAAATTDASPAASASSSADASESAATPSDDAGASPSFALPSFSLPSGAQDLEALLPDEICGTEALKFSLSGDDFEEQADEEMQAVLDEVGASASDVSMAVAGSATAEGNNCGAGILRIAGADTGQIQTAFISATEQAGDTVTEQTIGGRDVFSVESDGETQHVYFTGDTIVFVSAPEAELEALFAELP